MKGFLKSCFLVLLLSTFAVAMVGAGGQGGGGKVSVDLTYWSHCNYVGYDKFWETVAEKYNTEHPEVDVTLTVTCIPYQTYEAKYKSAFDAGKGPDIFLDMTHVTAGELEVSEKMPADISKTLEGIMAGPGKSVGIYDGVRYGVPVEGGYFMMNFINNSLFEEAGLAPKGAETFTEMLAQAKKVTKTDSSGKITQSG
jgi:ABC-type glycerol-3-phosphate transport system substrate-binding protein